MMSGGREVDVGGAVPIYKLVCNKPSSEFLTGGVEYCRSHERLGSWLLFERSMMKSSTLFERGLLLPYVHLASTRRHSCDRCSQAFPVFRRSSASMYYTERKPKNKKRGRPGNEAGLFNLSFACQIQIVG